MEGASVDISSLSFSENDRGRLVHRWRKVSWSFHILRRKICDLPVSHAFATRDALTRRAHESETALGPADT
jgi:hypothetical protein